MLIIKGKHNKQERKVKRREKIKYQDSSVTFSRKKKQIGSLFLKIK